MTQDAKQPDQFPRERMLMDPDWQFHLGEIAAAEAIDHAATYGSVKAGKAAGPAGLPHDWLIEQPFDASQNVSHGFYKPGVAWYRKHFTLPAEDLGRCLVLEFDGVFRNCTVWLNGHRLGNHPSGYTSFWFDVTDIANYGGENVLAVFVDAGEFEGWWYEGAGIYRHVWLTKTAPVHVAQWGTFVSAEVDGDPADPSSANVIVQTTVANESDEDAVTQLVSTVLDASGGQVAQSASEQPLDAWEAAEISQLAQVDAPHLWDVDSPYLYSLKTEIIVAGEVVDCCTTPFGIRTIRFDSETGFYLNGAPVKLKGWSASRRWAAMPTEPPTIRRRPNCWTPATAWGCS